ncbi:DUF2892 domain-containing protein [Methylobacillus gramineus]|uniref:YgaP family membrane protein n=1 Tax=Methylobacillus gramineus TaxID=755169 RepID=UPI001CFFA6B4|nr:DUF2892 domain-containing protein [Methylobacillus gramineus]MCB5185017.1 DUF2892 domain-containing protein [Methylobacillus gramineus]
MNIYDIAINDNADRVRRFTSSKINQEIDQQTILNIEKYSGLDQDAIRARIYELDKEWDIERVLEVNASTLSLAGLALGTFVNKKWFALSGGVMIFLLQHGVQGWCPPLPILRRLGIRTRGEIDYEKYSLVGLLS